MSQQTEADKLQAQLRRLDREAGRLVDAYQADIISLDDLDQRRRRLAERRVVLSEQYEQQLRLARESAHAQNVLSDLSAFCDRIRNRLNGASLEEKQAILQLLIDRVIVGEETLEIRHVIPLRGQLPTGSNSELPDCGLRRMVWIWHRWITALWPQTRLAAACSALEPSSTKSVGCVVSRPCSRRFSRSSVQTTAFSVAPYRRPRIRFVPSCVIPIAVMFQPKWHIG